ncbi:MAG: ABC transporter permease [Rubellimicrobium sp.]|nr:ABC transporter permease [Rubellimicrobium sp.]
MFQTRRTPSAMRSALAMLEVIYHSIVRDIRRTHRNAVAGLFLNIVQTMTFVLAFYLMFALIGIRGAALRGDFLLYIMSGIFVFMVHIKTVAAVVKAEGPASSMMQHAPLNTFITISASAIGSLYIQLLSLFVILFFYHVLVTPVVIDNPAGAMGMLLLSWLSGVGVGIVFAAIKPWFPEFVTVGSSVYSRINMIASGKMFVANSLPAHILPLFAWNPLFHIIDQARGFVFVNYNPNFTSIGYPLGVAMVMIVLGFMAESYTRRHASISWGAGR